MMVDEPLNGKKLYHIQDYFGHDFVEYEKFIEYADMNRQALVGVYFSEKDVKSACEFYLKYLDKPASLVKEYPEYRKYVDGMWHKYKDSNPTIHSAKEDFMKEYNIWLFKLAFKDVMEGCK